MSSRKAYVRVVETFDPGQGYPPIEVIGGIQLHAYEPLRSQYDRLRRAIRQAASPTVLHNFSDADINAAVEREIHAEFGMLPSYFIEVGRGNLDEYVQVYVP